MSLINNTNTLVMIINYLFLYKLFIIILNNNNNYYYNNYNNKRNIKKKPLS